MNNETETRTQNFESGRSTKGKIKEYGQEALKPFAQVLKNNHSIITPYIESVQKALRGSLNALEQENASSSDRRLAEWMRSLQGIVEQSRSEVKNQDYSGLLDKIGQFAQKNTALAFVGSYVAGLGLGRIGRHVAHKSSPSDSSQMTDSLPRAYTNESQTTNPLH